MLHVLIADDHPVVHLGLKLITEKVLEEPCHIDFAQSGDEVLRYLQEKKYSLLLCDLKMPDQKGVTLIGLALSIQPDLKIIIVSAGPERDFASQCLDCGAEAYINKGAPGSRVAEIIRSVVNGVVPDKPAMDRSNPKSKNQALFLSLSPREYQVVLLLLDGRNLQQVAEMLSLSASSVSTFKGRAFAKLSVNSLIGLHQLAYYHGLNLDRAMHYQ